MKNFKFRRRDEYIGEEKDPKKRIYREWTLENMNFIFWFYWSSGLIKYTTLKPTYFGLGKYGFDFRFFRISSQFRIKTYPHLCLE